MNIVKMQDTLKDLSDRQLMQTMQTGSSPQYLVLAEMQRRKKARESSKQQSQRQPERSVAEDIMSGIAAVPTGPMQMAEGGIVSFAKGGKTGRMKGEEEACYTDSRTGEKYCPPSRPQMETPRKSFQAGGGVGISPEEMADIDLRRRAQEIFNTNQNDILAVNPNATVDTVYESLLRSQQMTDGAAPEDPSPQVEPMEGRGGAAGSGYTFSDIAEGIGGLFAGRTEGGTRGEIARREPALEEEPEETPTVDPRTTGGRGAAGRATAEERMESEEAPAAEEAAGTDTPLPDPEPTGDGDGDGDDKPTAAREDGLMELMRELQEERKSIREESREDAINQALIRAGLTMAASDSPDFLTAAAEGGIGGLAGYQGAMESAAQRQGDISSEEVDLMVAREANDLRRQAAAARAAGAVSDMQFNRIDVLQNELENINSQLLEGVLTEEQTQQLETRRAQLAKALEAEYKNAGIQLTSEVGGGESDNPDHNAGNWSPN